jgi:hypothetical protein
MTGGANGFSLQLFNQFAKSKEVEELFSGILISTL